MHLHTCHQPGGSMEGHIYNAAKLGMHYIRFTDHDTRTGRKHNPVDSFDFSRGVIEYNDSKKNNCGWETVGSPEISFDKNGMNLTASSEGEDYDSVGIRFFSSGTRHTVSLIAEVSLLLGLFFEIKGDARIVLDVRLSQRPPEHKPGHFRYVFGELPVNRAPHTVSVPIEISPDGLYCLKLSDDIRDREEVGGLDNVFDTLSILLETRRGGSISCRVNRFEIKALYGYDDVIIRQRVIADRIGAKYGVKPFVTTEISGAGQHKNVFSTKVPVINYEKLAYSVTELQAIKHVKKHGGIFAYNHPFESDKYKRRSFTPEEINSIVMRDAASLISTRAYGASLMEVGFVEGRGYFGLAEYLRLWDLLSLGGVFITGYGDSDSHHNDKSWFDGQNFATWIAADEAFPFPVPEEEFITSMKSGRAYAGDPVHLTYSIDFFAGYVPMGGIITVPDRDTAARKMTFRAASPKIGSEVRVIADGELLLTESVISDGELVLDFELKPSRPVSFARVELYNPDGRCILLTNPIYLVRSEEYVGEIPECRIYTKEKND